MKYGYLPVFLIFFIFFSHTYGQNSTQHKEYYKWYDLEIGLENTGLFNGIRYSDQFRNTENNHIFYKDLHFKKGELTYDGETYYDIPMKYDLYNDHLIIDLKTRKGSNIIRVLNEKIDSFSIYKTRFVSLTDTESSIKKAGIFEPLYTSTELSSYKKYTKTAKKYLQSDRVNYSFKEVIKYFIRFNNKLYPVTSRNDIIRIFPQYKNNIKAFYKNHKQLMNSDYDLFLSQFTQKMSETISNKVQ